MTRTFVVGLDGASWRLLSPWIESGELPNLAALRSEGTWAAHRSCLPPVTFPNWKCYSSGKDPGGFGVFWFEQVDLEHETITVNNGADFETAELWDYLNDEGYSTGTVNMPTMYPPQPVDGVVVCGGPDAVEGEYRSISSGYTYPDGLDRELAAEFDYQVHPEPLLSSADERGAEVEAILSMLEKRFEVALHLFEDRDLDFMHVTLFYLNVLHHFFWNDEPTLRAWHLVDEWLGRLADLPDTNLVLMSDHGSAPTTTEFYINEWLAREGYQERQRTLDDALQTVGLNRENLLGIAKRAGLVDVLARNVPDRLQKLVPQQAGLKRERKLEAIDLDGTAAVASGQGPVYLTSDGDARRDDLIDALSAVSDEEGPLFTAAHRGEEVYTGPYVDEAPEIILDQRPGVHVNDGIGGGTVQSMPDRWAAENTPQGLFVAAGPDYDACGQIDPINIVDIAPTVLASFGCDVPTDMRGTVLPTLSNDQSWEHRDPITITAEDTTNRSEEVTDRLKQLGYME
jgi:predicted AlkP superfamily phosphohydrolase/phosphomutase